MDQLITAEFGIRQLHARYTDAVFRLDTPGFVDCFTRDGEWKIAGMHMRGHEELSEKFDLLLSTSALVQIIPGTPILELTAEGADGRVQVTELVQLKDGTSAMTIGVYHDQYAEEGGVWRFRRRHFSLYYRGPIDMTAELVPSPDYGPFPGRPAADEPTLTRRKQTD